MNTIRPELGNSGYWIERPIMQVVWIKHGELKSESFRWNDRNHHNLFYFVTVESVYSL